MANLKALMALALLGICFAYTIASTLDADNGCLVPIGNKRLYRYRWPLIFNSKAELLEANDAAQLLVSNDAEVLLSCAPNYLKRYYKQEVAHVKCNADTGNFTLIATQTTKNLDANVELNIKDLTCDLRVIEQVLAPVKSCSNAKWTAARFGYKQPLTEHTIVLGEACYDEAKGRTLFAHMQMGQTAANNYLDLQDKNYLISQRHPDESYKSALFRDLHFDEIYDNIRTQLHLKQAPELTLYNFIDEKLLPNAQLQQVKKLAWNYFVAHDALSDVLDLLKKDIRALSAQQNLHIYVGSHGVATLQGASKEQQMQLYLQHKRFPMPDLLWLLLQHEQKAIAIAVYNRAAANDVEDNADAICESICHKISWLSSALKTQYAKQVICCAYENMQEFIDEMPVLENVRENLV